MGLLKRSLLRRIVVYFFLLSLAVVLLMGSAGYLFIIRDTRHSVLEQINIYASQKEDALNRWVEEQIRKVVFLADLPELRDLAGVILAESNPETDAQAGHDALRGFFVDVLDHCPEFQEIFILDAEGGWIAVSSDLANEGQFRALDTFFVEGLKATYVQNVFLSPISLQPAMIVAHPLRSPDGQLLGVLAVNLKLNYMDRIVQEMPGSGKTGEAYLVDRYNVFVSAERFGRDEHPRGVHSRGIDSAIAGNDGTGIYKNYRGIAVLGAYRWLEDRELALLVEIHRGVAFASARRQTVLLALSGVTLILLLAAGVYLLARRITSPILTLEQAARQVAGGNLDMRVQTSSWDEIGVLAESFNRMTARLKKLYQQLRHREEYFRSLIENSLDVVAMLDTQGRIKFISPSVERLIGYSPDELVVMNPFDLVHPEDRARIQGEVFDQLVRGDRVLKDPVEFRIHHKDNRWHVVEAIGMNLVEHPAIKGIIINAWDISERRQLEDHLIRAQKMEAVGRLAGGIAHDFNNLLTAIIGYAEVLQIKLAGDRESLDYVLEIRRASERAASLTQQLLAYSRKQVLQLKPLDLGVLLRDMEGMLRRLIGEDIELVINLQPGAGIVVADAGQLQQVVLNLTVNARDAMPRGGRLTMEVDFLAIGPENLGDYDDLSPGNYVVLTISDTGTGIEPQSLQQIFDPFYTTKEVGKGTGLGLATVYGIVKQSRGHITVSSQLDHGTTFSIFLPVAPGSAMDEDGRPDGKEYIRGSESILVVEDEELVRGMIETALTQLGYSVRTATDPEAALEMADKGVCFQLLISDLVMPGMNGQQLAARLLERIPGLKVLYISGYAEDLAGQSSVTGKTGEAFAFLQKPFTTDALSRKVRDVLESR